jgi:hypothetical protein
LGLGTGRGPRSIGFCPCCRLVKSKPVAVAAFLLVEADGRPLASGDRTFPWSFMVLDMLVSV